MANMNHPKTITISGPAAVQMKQDQRSELHYKIEIEAFNWGGPIYRLVQTNIAEEDLAITDPQSGITVYASRDEADFFEDLDINLVTMFSDNILMVKERFDQP